MHEQVSSKRAHVRLETQNTREIVSMTSGECITNNENATMQPTWDKSNAEKMKYAKTIPPIEIFAFLRAYKMLRM